MSPVFRGGRRQGATRSSREYGGKTVYYCTGGAGTMAGTVVEPAPMGLTWLPGGGHCAVTSSGGPGPRSCAARCAG